MLLNGNVVRNSELFTDELVNICSFYLKVALFIAFLCWVVQRVFCPY